MRRALSLRFDGRLPLVAGAIALVAVLGAIFGLVTRDDPIPSFRSQVCSLTPEWLGSTQRGYFAPRSGQISLLPRYPAYMASGGGGWSHSGPWPYLQRVPLVFYGPGLIPKQGDVGRPATLADVAPTTMTLLHGFYRSDGEPLPEVARLSGRALGRARPKLVLTVVLDGGGWNTLEQWPNTWPNLARLAEEGVSYVDATVGSSPSVTPAVHTTIGTGYFPWTHGITGVPVRDESGEVVDSFLNGDSSRFIRVPTLAERWDEQNANRALIGMIGYEPWHLGMIGKGAEDRGGDRDDAAWLDTETNDWIANEDHYRLPPSVSSAGGLESDLERLDAADGRVDRAWREHGILDEQSRVEETPAFIAYHARALMKLIEDEGYGEDAITDLLFTNFKQIDRVGHYFNMASEEVRDSVETTDEQLGNIVSFLDREIGRGGYVVIVTADHGQQPDAKAVDGFGIDPNEIEQDIRDEFGPVVRAVWPTEAFLYPDELDERGVTVADVARFLGDYRLSDNTQRPDMLVGGAGRFESDARLFEMAVPSETLAEVGCGLARPEEAEAKEAEATEGE